MSGLICHLPLWLSLKVGRALAKVLWLFLPAKRKSIATGNIVRCLAISEDKAKRLARASWLQLGSMFFEVLAFPKIKGSLPVKVTGLEHLQEYKQGTTRGALIVTCHSDNWELMGGAFAQNGIQLVGVAKKQKSTGADKFINEYRRLLGMQITYSSSVRDMYKQLDAGAFIGLISDQDVGRSDGVVVKFFNQATNFVTGAASMSRFRLVPIFPAFMHRNPDSSHTLEILPPIYCTRSADKLADIARTTQLIASLFEQHIRHYPAQWFWLHDRWKSIRLEFSRSEIADLEFLLGIHS